MNSKILLVIFILLWVLDTLFTTLFVDRLGLEAEANPIIRFIIQNYGFVSFLIFKFVVLIPIILLRHHVSNWILVLLNLIMFPVVILGGIMAFGL